MSYKPHVKARRSRPLSRGVVLGSAPLLRTVRVRRERPYIPAVTGDGRVTPPPLRSPPPPRLAHRLVPVWTQLFTPGVFCRRVGWSSGSIIGRAPHAQFIRSMTVWPLSGEYMEQGTTHGETWN